ncbi:MAG: multidrug effflux MFS transporter, partial [Brachybacterium sp.]|nr:multidrug effflux MFS transporter [Brachybacterium sp.]
MSPHVDPECRSDADTSHTADHDDTAPPATTGDTSPSPEVTAESTPEGFGTVEAGDTEADEEYWNTTGNVSTIGGAVSTMTGSIPVMEDEGNREHAHLPSAEEIRASRTRVTGVVIAVLTSLSAIGPLATDMYIPAFPQVTQDLATSPARLQLTLTAFFLGVAAGQIVAGPLSDRFGRRLPLMAGISLCLAASLGCMFAPDVTWLLIFRVLQGVGGGFGMVLGRAVLIDLTSGPELFKTMNLMQGIAGIAPIVAPLFGGLVLLVGEWRDVFGVIAAISFISLIGTIFLIPESLPMSRRHSGGFRTFLRNVRILLGRPVFVSYLLVNMFSAFALMAYVSASSFVVQDMLGYSATVYSA